MVNIRWIKNEAGHLAATCTPCASDKLVRPMKLAPDYGKSGFLTGVCRNLRKAA